MKRLLQCLLIVTVVVVGWTMISAKQAEGARVRVYAGYPYYSPYVVRYRAPYYPYVPVAPVVGVPAYYPPPVVVYPRYRCVPPPICAPAPCYQVW